MPGVGECLGHHYRSRRTRLGWQQGLIGPAHADPRRAWRLLLSLREMAGLRQPRDAGLVGAIENYLP
jgi:hypothetical protein